MYICVGVCIDIYAFHRMLLYTLNDRKNHENKLQMIIEIKTTIQMPSIASSTLNDDRNAKK